MPNRYTLEVTNDSYFPGDICVYQGCTEVDELHVMSLAWFSRYAYPSSTVTVSWTLDYSFHWAYSGELKPGLRFQSTQSQPANLRFSNQITLNYDDENDAFRFKDQTQNKQGGSFHIEQDATIPPTSVAAGVGVSGAAAFAMQARPNWNFIFTPSSTYWVTFGTFEHGEVLDRTSISQRQQIIFPSNCYRMRARLTPANTWTVSPA